MFEMFLLISVKLTSDLEFLCYLRKNHFELHHRLSFK